MRILAILASLAVLAMAPCAAHAQTTEHKSRALPNIGQAVPVGEWMIIQGNGAADMRSPPVAMLRSSDNAALLLHCVKPQNGQPLLQPSVFSKAALGQGQLPARRTLVRFDDKTPTSYLWNYGKMTGGPARSEDAVAILMSVRETKTMRVQLVDYRLNVFTVNFNLAPEKTRSIMDDMIAGCRHAARPL